MCPTMSDALAAAGCVQPRGSATNWGASCYVIVDGTQTISTGCSDTVNSSCSDTVNSSRSTYAARRRTRFPIALGSSNRR